MSVTAIIFMLILTGIAAWVLGNIRITMVRYEKVPHLPPIPLTVVDEYHTALALLHRARFEVGALLRDDIELFLQGTNSEASRASTHD